MKKLLIPICCKVCFVLLFGFCAFQAFAADNAWPPLPKSSLTITNLGPRPSVKNVKTNLTEVRRDGKRVASITRVDRNGDGKFEEFVFTAFVSKEHVFTTMRIGGTNESSMFVSFDDVIVNANVRIPETDIVALLVMSKKHGCYEIFTRQPDGCYWPADDSQRAAVDAFFRAGAQAISPLLEKLKQTRNENGIRH